LKQESIHIIREVASEFERPVMLYSIGKISSVMLRLAQKAFHPGPLPFPLLHIDTGFKFREMLAFRDEMARSVGAKLLVWRNEPTIAAGTNPIVLDPKRCCGPLKNQALLDGLRHYKFDAAFGGARRDKEKSRAKERIYSFRDDAGQWDPKNQRPELWNLYNARIHPGESIRVVPLSNWTEMGVWQYIHEEKIRVSISTSPRSGRCMCGGTRCFPSSRSSFRCLGKEPQIVESRLHSLRCSPCTGAIRSDAETIPNIIAELLSFKSSERANRAIDHDQEDSMEIKKREGYF
jgi:sulfate adenylyltransferase subunit 2